MGVFTEKEILELNGEKLDILDEQEALIKAAEIKGRNLTAEEKERFDDLEIRYQEIEKRLKELENEDGNTNKFSQFNLISSRGNDMKNYNLTRAIKHLCNMSVDSSKETDLSAELEERSGISAGKGLLVPISAIKPEKREITTSGDGGNLVPQEHLDSDFIDVLRNASAVMSMSPTVLDNLEGTVHIPKKTGAAATGWISGDSKASTLTADDITFDTLSLSPKYVGVLTEYSLDISIRSAPAVEEIARQDIADSIATEVDRASLDGSGSSNEPTGILNTSGITTQSTTATAGPDWSELLGAVEAVMSNGVNITNGGWLSPTEKYSYFGSTDKGSDTGEYLETNGMIGRYPVRYSDNVPSGRQVFGNWSDLVIAHWGVMRFLVNPYEHFDSGSVQIRGILPIDIGIRHAESFTELRDTTT